MSTKFSLRLFEVYQNVIFKAERLPGPLLKALRRLGASL